MRCHHRSLVTAIVMAVLSTALAPAVIAQASATRVEAADAEAATLSELPARIGERVRAVAVASFALVGQAQGTGATDTPALAEVVRSGPRSSGAVALTFDDGFEPAVCADIADALRDQGAVGTFFVNGMHLQSKPARWRSILEGMPVGNHTRSHHDLLREPHPVVIRQILHNEAIHERVLGRPMSKLLRPPYGAYGERIQAIAAQLGYDRLLLWSVDTYDWKPSTSAREIVRRATRAPPGSIILMHCSRDATARALPAIIRHYQSRGITLASVDEVLGLAIAEPTTSTPTLPSRLIDS
jgi:peptidoglycan/xylan/chitin deacetylase (PgdA/CDA1 family)